jgi:hypothetical protein
MTEYEKAVLKIIQERKGREQKIGRKLLLYLVRKDINLAISDRALQEIIENLRANGNLICSTSADGGGYYTPQSWDEWKSFSNEQMSRVKRISEKNAKMKKAAKRAFPDALPLLGE